MPRGVPLPPGNGEGRGNRIGQGGARMPSRPIAGRGYAAAALLAWESSLESTALVS
jgi:hypothetical protein